MKNLLQRITRLVFILGLVFVLACEGPVGPEGPMGLQGEQGEQGEKGEKGDTGDDGQDGNANIATVTFTIKASDYSPFRDPETGEIVLDFAAYQVPEITDEVATNGAVIGYWGVINVWWILPFNGIDFTFVNELIEVRMLRDSFGTSLVKNLENSQLRFVIIYPPSMNALDGIDLNDYDAVMEALDINI